MHFHILGFPTAVGLIAFVLGGSLWHYEKTHRLSVWLLAFGAFLLTVGILPWRNALAALVASATGLVVLLLLDVVTGLGFWFEATHKKKTPKDAPPEVRRRRRKAPPEHHHRVRTPVLGIAFGVCALLTIASSARIFRKMSQSPGKTSQALGMAVKQIGNGHAAQSMAHSQALMVFGIGCAVVVVLIIAGHKHENPASQGGRAAIERGAAHAALPSGRGK